MIGVGAGDVQQRLDARMWRNPIIGAISGGLLAAMTAVDAQASGYALREQSGSMLGTAFASSAAGAEDLSTAFYNPAGLTRLTGSQLLAAGSLIVPSVKVGDVSASTAAGVPITGGDGGHEVVPDAFVPVFYALWDLQESFALEQNVKLAVAVNVPFALQSTYANGWAGRYHALDSRLTTFNVSPVVAYEALPGVSLAAGLQIQYADARLTNALDFGSIGRGLGLPPAVARPTQQDGRAEVSGDDFGFGYSLALLYEPWQGTRFGAAFRSEVSHNLKGDADFDLDSAGVGQLIAGRTGAFVDSKATARMTTPWSVTFGFSHDLTEDWTIVGTVERTGWSAFDQLRVKFQNPAQPDSVSDQDWNDSWFGALGVIYRPSESWTLRGGVAWDESPIPERKRSPRIPTDDRGWIAFGAGYRPLPNVMIDFGYAHLFFRNAGFNLTAAESGNQARGNVAGDVDASADIISLQAWVLF
jgi:long-chain fatty acid transport protein